jgi:uroporphyrinogen decarboxylase
VLFDTWAASLPRADYLRYAAPWTRRIVLELAASAPLVIFGGAADHLLDDLLDMGAAGVALDHRTSISRAFQRAASRCALQGNFDPAALFASPDEVARRTHALLDEVKGQAGHVLNLGHGVFKDTDPDCVGAFVRAAQEH